MPESSSCLRGVPEPQTDYSESDGPGGALGMNQINGCSAV
jgi:hypothetical protein